MNGTHRNFWMDLALFALLGSTMAFLAGMARDGKALHPGTATHVHALCGFFMTVGSLVHIWMHRKWVRAVVTGKVKGRPAIRLAMNMMVTVFMLLACISGGQAMESPGVNLFHAIVGSAAILGLVIHSTKHAGWMAGISRKPSCACGSPPEVPGMSRLCLEVSQWRHQECIMVGRVTEISAPPREPGVSPPFLLQPGRSHMVGP